MGARPSRAIMLDDVDQADLDVAVDSPRRQRGPRLVCPLLGSRSGMRERHVWGERNRRLAADSERVTERIQRTVGVLHLQIDPERRLPPASDAPDPHPQARVPSKDVDLSELPIIEFVANCEVSTDLVRHDRIPTATDTLYILANWPRKERRELATRHRLDHGADCRFSFAPSSSAERGSSELPTPPGAATATAARTRSPTGLEVLSVGPVPSCY